MDKIFWGQRETKWSDVRDDALQTFFNKPTKRPVLAGQIAQHFRCGLLEAEKILDRMCDEGLIREINGHEAAEFGTFFGYVAAGT